MKFTVIRGKEGGRDSFLGKMTWDQFVRVFDVVDEQQVDADQRCQRELMALRTAGIAEYIAKSPDDFVFPSVVAIVDQINFHPLSDSNADIGSIDLTDQARYLCDGQGRLSGIRRVMKERPELNLGVNTIDVKLLPNASLESNQQVFADLNMNPVKPSRSISITFDHRKVINQVAKSVVNANPEIKALVDFERANVSASSPYLWTINQVARFVVRATGLTAKGLDKTLVDPVSRGKVVRFLNELFGELLEHNELIRSVAHGQLKAQALKKDTIIGTAVWLESFGVLARVLQFDFIANGRKDWSGLDRLNQVDMGRGNPEWLGRCLSLQGRIVKNSESIHATAAVLVTAADLDLPKELSEANERVGALRVAVRGESPVQLKVAS